MAVSFRPAQKRQKKLRMALMGPSGSGKTYTALVLASELAKGGRVAVIDTERGSASLYSDLFAFDSCELESFHPQHYIDAVGAAAAAGYSALVIDSLSHAWVGEGGVLDQVSRRGGNSFADGWGKVGTPLQNSLVKAVLEAPMHVVATMRVKTEYAVEQDARGKSVPKRVGLAAVQREGVEYEFDIVGVLDIQNTLTVEKTRMAALSGQIVAKPDAKLARQIAAWLSDGAPPAGGEALRRVAEVCDALGYTDAKKRDALHRLEGRTEEEVGAALAALNEQLAERRRLTGEIAAEFEKLGYGEEDAAEYLRKNHKLGSLGEATVKELVMVLDGMRG